MQDRIRTLNQRAFDSKGEYILYWSQMNRRVDYNHALLHAVELANERKLPVLFYEGLTCTYPYANDRLHTFILEGVPDTAEALKKLGIGYCFYPRKRRKDANDVFYKLAAKAAAVVTDDYPTFIAATHNASVPEKLSIPFIAVDSSCIVPMNRMEKREYAAYTIRPKIHKLLPQYMEEPPAVKVAVKWKLPVPEFHTEVTRQGIPALVAECEIDHTVKPSTTWTGGSGAALRLLEHFLQQNLKRYANGRNDPTAHATSNMSPYLHFGHISALQIALEAKAYAKTHQLIADEFLEELIVRRELAFNFGRFAANPESLENLPDWARQTLNKHAGDKRDPAYTREQLEAGATCDALWNATQKELLLRGKIHGYYRMYWGKKIIEWSKTNQDALDVMIYLHDRYALDGRDPNTYTNILWCFGLHDRPWTERPIFGMIRYMSYDGMKRKTAVDAYIREIRYLEETGRDPHRIE